MLDFNMWALILTCLKLIGASIVIGITLSVLIAVVVIIWTLLKEFIDYLTD